jgi:hypothetical protein
MLTGCVLVGASTEVITMAKHTITSSPITDTHYLGLGLVATATYSYEPPRAAPDSGSAWDNDLDLPAVMCVLSLPVRTSVLVPTKLILHPSLVAPDTRVLGWGLEPNWGARKGDERVTIRHYRERTLTLSLATARADVATAIATLRGIVAAREARLVLREATIAAAEED